ncbi:hypothetical protein JCM17846_07150 [Iodidimonas nitroreducens]|uniref:Flagellar basal body rod protein N-terminal domain-containing protein n=2 Tax=Iodidimonas nitroreducens TaxID=1236968 RepID=A0A5A7N433_9PROT|nr:hypothetical protein JCM17846_07150 [Iodidimonas nitroreducens]
MDTLLSIGLSHQGAMLRRMDVIANNIANASTTAFKRERVVFQDYLFTMKGEGPKELRDVRMVLDYGVVPDMSKGEFIMTRNPLDVAMENEASWSSRMMRGSAFIPATVIFASISMVN